MLYRMDSLCNFNWAKFVIDGLLDAVKVFQVRRAKSLGGCLLYLQVRATHPYNHFLHASVGQFACT